MAGLVSGTKFSGIVDSGIVLDLDLGNIETPGSFRGFDISDLTLFSPTFEPSLIAELASCFFFLLFDRLIHSGHLCGISAFLLALFKTISQVAAR